MINKIINRQTGFMFAIFFIAIFFRLAGPYLQETYFFHRQFLIPGPELYSHFKSDELVYNFTAKSIIEGKGFSLNAHEVLAAEKGIYDDKTIAFLKDTYCLRGKQNAKDSRYWHHNLTPPLYAAFLAFLYYLFGVSTLAYYLPQVFLGAMTCVFTYMLARELFDKNVAMIAGLGVALYPELIFWSYAIRPETLYMFFLTLGFLLLIKANKNGNVLLLFFGGVVLGLASLTRITLLPFFLVLISWQFWFAAKGRRIIISTALFLGISLTILPWVARNFIVFKEITFFTHEVSVILAGNLPLEKIQNSYSSTGYFAQFYNYFIDDACGYFLNSFGRFIAYLSPFTAGMNKIAKIYKFIGWLIVFPAGFLGIIFSVLKSWRNYSLISLFVLYYIAIHVATCVDIGLVYRFPIIPFMCIFASYTYRQFYVDFYCGKAKEKMR